MKYVLTPTDDDILHYKKGSESKSHKYISRVFNKGKWVYIYAKNRLRGNNVTNKTGKSQYAPNVKTKYINRADGHTIKTLNEPHWFFGTNPHHQMDTGKKDSVTNQGSPDKQYNPTVKTIDTKRDIGGTTVNLKGHNISTALAENMTAETKATGLDYFSNIMGTHYKESVTNQSTSNSDLTGVSKQYTPSYKTPDSSKHYTPDIRTNMPVNPSLKTPLSYTQTSADPIKYDRLIRRDLGQKSLAEQYAEQEKKKKNKKK